MPLINQDLLAFDATLKAEEITGKEYNKDKDTFALSWLLRQDHEAKKQKALIENCDTYYNQTTDKFIEILNDLKFELAYTEVFVSNSGELEDLYIYYRKDGQILLIDTYNKKINSAIMYYNWKPSDLSYNMLHSGHYAICDEENKIYVWSGYQDVREAIRYKIQQLNSTGDFICPWISCPIHFLANKGYYFQKKDDNKLYYEASNRIMRKLPSDMKTLFGPQFTTLGGKI